MFDLWKKNSLAARTARQVLLLITGINFNMYLYAEPSDLYRHSTL